MIACGTAAALLPIRSITCKSAGDEFVFAASSEGKVGAVCKQLFEYLNGVQRGNCKDEWEWARRITEKDLLALE